MRSRRTQRGLTLVELLIVVAIVGVLAMLAFVWYRHHTNAAHVQEATNMVANIRASEENFRAENGAYLDVTGMVGPINAPQCDYPAVGGGKLPVPGAFATSWGGNCPCCLRQWTTLAVQPDAPLYYGYAVVADQTVPPQGRGVTVVVKGQPVDLTNMSHGAPWFVVEADGDVYHEGKFTNVFGMSGTNQIWVSGPEH